MSKKQIIKIEQPKTNDRIEQLRYLAKLRGEYEEEKPKLNVKRFLLISAIIIAILVAGLIFTSSKINEINRHNEDVLAAQRLAQQIAEAATAETTAEETPTVEEVVPETLPDDAGAEEAAITEEAGQSVNEDNTAPADPAAETAASLPETSAASPETARPDKARTYEVVRLVLLLLLIACAAVFYIIMKRRTPENRKKRQLSLMCAILVLLLAGVILFGILADNSESQMAAVETVTTETATTETVDETEAGEGEAETAVVRTADTDNQVDTSIATWNLVHFLLIVLLIVYGVFMLVKLAHPKRRKPNRSFWGDFGIYFMMAIIAVAMVFPLVFNIATSLKPLDELFRFPPRVFAQHPTLDNFSDLFVTMGQSYVPFSRYLTNTVLITFVGTLGHVVIASMAAFVLAKYNFPGGRTFFSIVVTALMFSGYVTGIPNYVIMSRLRMIDTYWAIILPAFAAPIGLFLMKQFMEGLPTALIEAAHLDGAGEFRIFWTIVMPNVKPAWLTIIIFSVQSLWNTNAAIVIYTEKNKTLVYALQQIQAGGIARTGQAAAISVIVMIVPVVIFILSQSRILETMASSGLKD